MGGLWKQSGRFVIDTLYVFVGDRIMILPVVFTVVTELLWLVNFLVF
jgi:hypothetical protein